MSLRLVVDPAVISDYPALGVSIGVTDFQPVNGPTTPYGHNIPGAGYFVVRLCDGVATFFDGPLTAQQVAAIAACPTDTNQASIRQKALTAFTRRNAFIALASPTNAQVIAELKAQGKDLNGLARLIFGQFDTAGDS